MLGYIVQLQVVDICRYIFIVIFSVEIFNRVGDEELLVYVCLFIYVYMIDRNLLILNILVFSYY